MFFICKLMFLTSMIVGYVIKLNTKDRLLKYNFQQSAVT